MLQIPINTMTEQGLDLNEAVEANLLPLLRDLARKEGMRFIRPVHVHLHATRIGETILIDGTVVTGVRIPCSRCLTQFDLPVEADFSATATPHMTSVANTDDAAEIELVADEMDVMVYSGDRIELADEIAQQIIMALPFNPQCRNTCKGLCNHCGADLNQTSCQCAAKAETNVFAVLKNLSLPKNKE